MDINFPKYTEEELKALDQKACNPQEKVNCPRCGRELTYYSVGNSYEVKCPTENCIKLTCRGL